MDFQSAMETFAEAWVAANSKAPDYAANGLQTQALALITPRERSSPPSSPAHVQSSPVLPPPPATPPPATVLPEDSSKPTTGKSLPVHCIVETVWSLQQWKSSKTTRNTAVETDSYVIIPVNTAFQDLVQVALQRLGYSKEIAAVAKGSIVIKNWKPLSFDKIAESPQMTVGELLGELTTIATVRIQIFRSRPSALTDMKEKLLRLLLVQSHALLLSSGCPLDEVTLSQLVRNQASPMAMSEPSEEVRRKFDQWWSLQLNQQLSPRPPRQICWNSPPPPMEVDPTRKQEKTNEDRVHPALQTVQSQYPTQKTRMRTSFDPELELPKLQRWFYENQHPSRQQIQQYVKELNSLESRRGRKPLDVNNVVYWFKNARAAQKRAEVRSLIPGMHCSIGLNGYNSNSQSPSDTGMIKSPGSVNQEDDEDDDGQDGRPSSPNVPLSLTTSRPASQQSPSAKGPTSPPSASTHQVEGIKQEPPDQEINVTQPESPGSSNININENNINNRTSSSSSNNNNNNTIINNNNKNNSNTSSNNNTVKEQQSNDLSDDDEDEDIDEEGSERGERGVTIENRSPDREGREPMYQNLESPDLQMMPRSSSTPCPGFPMVPNSMFSHSIMYMSHYIPNLNVPHNPSHPNQQGLNLSALADERRKRNRTFIDPVSEVPRLEQWFALNTHPSHNLILKYTDDLNRMPYRQKFPRLEPKNVQFWFKNRRAKCKRLKMSLFDSPSSGLQSQQSYHHHLAAALSGESFQNKESRDLSNTMNYTV
ncbi:SATB1_N and homeodomain domain-containing protein dve [Lycorma delicatula]|uniref:SATB1_N and homeodomain domain-containing protein dve n=1 Tax=Lycorma delicatula TaxID=130591 RepID=UPI003F510070